MTAAKKKAKKKVAVKATDEKATPRRKSGDRAATSVSVLQLIDDGAQLDIVHGDDGEFAAYMEVNGVRSEVTLAAVVHTAEGDSKSAQNWLADNGEVGPEYQVVRHVAGRVRLQPPTKRNKLVFA